MSLLQDEDFVVYQLRSAYLSLIKDGVGERLINVNSSVLNNQAYRAAGWVPNAADIKRTYSPPIPTAVTSEYFQAPRSVALRSAEHYGDDDEEGGMVTGGGASNDTVGPTTATKRRRRKQTLDEEDSSDLSDDSDDEPESTHRATSQIKFTKMPLRTRAGSSPIRGSNLRTELTATGEGPSVMVTSPSRPPEDRLRGDSLGPIETIKERERADTVTSSEMSSENELDNMTFQKKKLNPRRAAQNSQLLQQRIQEDERERLEALEEGDESDSSLSSEFAGTVDSASLLGEGSGLISTPHNRIANMPSFSQNSPKKGPRQANPTMQALPPPRPISFIPPVSALTQALKAKEKTPSNPLQRFAALSAASEAQVNPIYIKIYCPFSKKPNKPLELLVVKNDDKGEPVSVSETIGFALWRYQEEKMEPALTPEKSNVNAWVLRMYEDGEVDDEFPPLNRNKPMMNFASNNSRGMRPRARDKPWDEFGLVEANPREFEENEKITPRYSREAAAALASQQSSSPGDSNTQLAAEKKPLPPTRAARAKSFRNPITGPSFAPTATRKDTSTLADAPSARSQHSASRTGAPKVVTVHFTDENFNTRHTPINATTDTYIAEIFDTVCQNLGVDKAIYVLKVSGSTTVAPLDRTVEALGDRTDLDLVRRRFVGDGLFISGSPGSSSPNAPLVISAPVVSSKKAKKGDKGDKGSALGRSLLSLPLAKGDASAYNFPLTTSYYRRYNVIRKQPMSFASSTSRTLTLDSEYLHIMPGEITGGAHNMNNPPSKGLLPGFEGAGTAKTTTVPFTSVIGSKVSKKHPKIFRVLVWKEREHKRYDFEAASRDEAAEIVREIRRGMERNPPPG